MRLAAGIALPDQQLALRRGVEEALILDIGLGRGDLAGLAHHCRSRIRVAAPWRAPRAPPMPVATARPQSGTCTAGCASPRNWRTASIPLVMPPRLVGWLLHKPPPSVLNGSLPDPEMRLP